MTKNHKHESLYNVMVVDDERDILTVIKKGLEASKKFKVETFSSGEAALKDFMNRPYGYYDLILTDIRMPKMSGFELSRHIMEQDPEVKIVFITAFEINKDEFRKVMPSLDIRDFITKPISISDLVTKLITILKSQNKQKIPISKGPLS
jgi:two-component system response regulator ChvI